VTNSPGTSPAGDPAGAYLRIALAMARPHGCASVRAAFRVSATMFVGQHSPGPSSEVSLACVGCMFWSARHLNSEALSHERSVQWAASVHADHSDPQTDCDNHRGDLPRAATSLSSIQIAHLTAVTPPLPSACLFAARLIGTPLFSCDASSATARPSPGGSQSLRGGRISKWRGATPATLTVAVGPLHYASPSTHVQRI